MELSTKLVFFIQNFLRKINKKFIFFKIYFATGIFFLFLGFLFGNLFGSFLIFFQKSIIWSGLITLIIILFSELISFLMYHNTISKKNLNDTTIVNYLYKILKINSLISLIFQNFFFQNKKNLFSSIPGCKKIKRKINFHSKIQNLQSLKKKPRFFLTNFWIKILNLFKVGILLGFFIDAFKVGS